MTKKQRMERAELVIAMDKIAKCFNDEDVYMGWLMCGVADGDIKSDTTPEEVLDDYLDDDTFSELMGYFVSIMYCAKKRNKKSNKGTLCATGVISKGEDVEEDIEI